MVISFSIFIRDLFSYVSLISCLLRLLFDHRTISQNEAFLLEAFITHISSLELNLTESKIKTLSAKVMLLSEVSQV